MSGAADGALERDSAPRAQTGPCPESNPKRSQCSLAGLRRIFSVARLGWGSFLGLVRALSILVRSVAVAAPSVTLPVQLVLVAIFCLTRRAGPGLLRSGLLRDVKAERDLSSSIWGDEVHAPCIRRALCVSQTESARDCPTLCSQPGARRAGRASHRSPCVVRSPACLPLGCGQSGCWQGENGSSDRSHGRTR
eukprot:1078128-Pleurochrysis_carterae.AAC.1